MLNRLKKMILGSTLFTSLFLSSIHGFYKSDSSPFALVEQGKDWVKKGDFGKAAELFQEAARQNRNFFDAWFYLGVSLEKLGEKSQSLQAFEIAYGLKPDHPDTLVAMSRILLEKTHTMKEGLDLVAKAYKIQPGNPRVKYHLAIALFKMNFHGPALNHFQEILKVYPDHSDSHYYSGLAYTSMGKRAEALHHFQAVTRLQPTLKTHLAIASIYEETDDPGKALHHYQYANSMISNREDPRVSQFIKKKMENLEDLTKNRMFSTLKGTRNQRQNWVDPHPKLPLGIPVKRDNYKSLHKGGDTFDTGIEFAGNYQGDYENFSDNRTANRNQARPMPSGQLDYHLNLATGYLRQNLVFEAEKELNQILNQGADSTQSFQARKLMDEIQRKKAAQLSIKAESHLQLGTQFLGRDRLREAENELQTARGLNPSNPHIQKALAILEIKKGDHPTASEYIKKSMLLDPNLQDNYILLALILRSEGRFGEALGMIGKASSLKGDTYREEYISELERDLTRKQNQASSHVF